MRSRFSYRLVNGMLSAGVPIGLLLVRWMRRRHKTSLLRSMADDMAAAAAFATFGYLIGRKADELAKSAETDALTGLYNARGLETRLSTELERSARYQAPLSLLLIDLDRLKEINDRYGHYAGQTALRQVAAAIQAELRASDIGARWGGDEFAVAAPNTATGAAWAMAERIRTTISKAAMRWPLTASIGIATVDAAGLSSAVDIEILMRSADAALYDAKRQGRNRVAIGRTLTRVQAQRSDGHPFEPPDAPTPEPVVSH